MLAVLKTNGWRSILAPCSLLYLLVSHHDLFHLSHKITSAIKIPLGQTYRLSSQIHNQPNNTSIHWDSLRHPYKSSPTLVGILRESWQMDISPVLKETSTDYNWHKPNSFYYYVNKKGKHQDYECQKSVNKESRTKMGIVYSKARKIPF